MREIFADTGYWVALLNPRDEHHATAIRLSRSLGGCTFLTTHEVLTEVLNYLSGYGPHLRTQICDWSGELEKDPSYLLLEYDIAVWNSAVNLYRARPDKKYSLTDCISFVVMRNLGITEALTHDRHFEQEGFTALLRTS